MHTPHNIKKKSRLIKTSSSAKKIIFSAKHWTDVLVSVLSPFCPGKARKGWISQHFYTIGQWVFCGPNFLLALSKAQGLSHVLPSQHPLHSLLTACSSHCCPFLSQVKNVQERSKRGCSRQHSCQDHGSKLSSGWNFSYRPMEERGTEYHGKAEQRYLCSSGEVRNQKRL